MRIVCLALITVLTGCGGEEPMPQPAPPAEKPAKAKVKAKAEPPGVMKFAVGFSSPDDGAKVTSPLDVVFMVMGMEVRPAGDLTENTGHHHLIIDGAPIPKGTAVPKDATHMHFGEGQVKATIELEPGEHTLTMQFADGNHISYGPAYSKTITVEVSP